MILKPDQFIDNTYDLVSDTGVENYDFGSNGVVLATVGTRAHGVALLAFDWKIVDSRTLQILDTQSTNSYQFKSFTEDKAVTTDGKTFKRKSWKK